MKVHVTNIYGFNNQIESIQRQHYFADVARELKFYEMGIFRYPVDSDSQSELSRRMDGIIASIEYGDVVFCQLPTGNGLKFDSLFVDKLKAYHSTVVLILHEVNNEWMNVYKRADSVVVFGRKEKTCLEYNGIENIFILDGLNEYSIKKMYYDLLDYVHYMFDRESKSLNDEIHVGFGLHDRDGNYTVWVGVAIQSILDHTCSNVCFHVLHDSTLSMVNKRKLIQVADTNRSRIVFHLIDSSAYDLFKEQVGHFSVGSLFRAELPSLVNESKILYLDADILVNCDIKDLWNIDIDKYCIGAVADYGVSHHVATTMSVQMGEIERDSYFNAGVLSMNLDKIRSKSNLKEELISYIKNHPESVYTDQDALNVIYKNDTLILDEKWNSFVRVARDKKEGLKDVLYHYAGTTLCLYTMCEVDLLYFQTLVRTPWIDSHANSILKMNFGRVADRVNQLELILSKISNQTKLVFYGEETYNMKNLYSFFNVNPEKDYRVSVNHLLDGILKCKNLDSLKEENDFIVFVYPGADDGHSMENLEKLGLINGKDFFVVPRFVSFKDGGFIL